MRLTDLNFHGEIGANSLFVEIGNFKILVDSGLHPKKSGNDSLPNFDPIRAVDLDLIILTHCHLDHLGSMPIVTTHNPKTPVLTSMPNRTLAPRMLRNSINVMKHQRWEHGLPELPLFQHRDVAQFVKQLTGRAFGQRSIYTKRKDRIDVILHPAGHVAGATAIELIHTDRRIVFSGDVLFDPQRTIPGAQLPDRPIHTLILETTRGAKGRESGKCREDEIKQLIQKIRAILERDGSCLIPVFALGRMQELFKILYEGLKTQQLPPTPIFAAGLGMDVCRYFDKIRRQTKLIDFDLRILDQLNVQRVDRNTVPGRDLPKKGIYLLSSGMMVKHTPSYKIAASLLPHPSNGIIFVGYCDPDTPGGQLLAQKNASTFFFDALNYTAPLRASIDQFDLSGHADRDELVQYAVDSSAESIILTHGDNEARTWFEKTLRKKLKLTSVLNPEPLVPYTIR